MRIFNPFDKTIFKIVEEVRDPKWLDDNACPMCEFFHTRQTVAAPGELKDRWYCEFFSDKDHLTSLDNYTFHQYPCPLQYNIIERMREEYKKNVR